MNREPVVAKILVWGESLKLSCAVKKPLDGGQTKMWPEPLFWLRTVLLSSTFFGLLSCWPLWFNAREFPLTRITPWFPVLPSPWDKLFFGTMLIAMLVAMWRYRPAVILFLAATFFAWGEDQN